MRGSTRRSSQAFWQFDLRANTWAPSPNTPATVNQGGALAYDGANLYALRGGIQVAFWRFDLTAT